MTTAWEGIDDEFRPNNAVGARVIAVAGADGERSRRAADALADALAAQGEQVQRLDTQDADAARLREEIVAPFRADRTQNRVLVIAGPEQLLADGIRPLWHFTLWHSAEDEPVHPDASSLIDMTNQERPLRRYRDSCGTAECCGD